MIYKHICGCITEDNNGTIGFKKLCNKHQNIGYVWVALQHPNVQVEL